MYAFRKPFTAGEFDTMVALPLLPPVHYKIVLVISQVFGYTVSKFIGIKVVSELAAARRGLAILVLIAWAELALLGFAMAPTPWDAVFLFLNGVPLGMIWGLVFGFLEGRQASELLGAGLSASYIVASGVVKSIGAKLIDMGVPEQWMPVTTGLLFLVPMIFFVALLRAIPPPSAQDEALRIRREPMDGRARRQFFQSFAPGLLGLIGLYILLTSYRDFRDNFAREIWGAVGFADQPEIFAIAEIPIALIVLVALALLMRIRDNRRALAIVHLMMAFGSALIGILTLAHAAELISPTIWLIGVGVGLYLGYVPFGCILFDRLIACVGWPGTAAFMIYLSDSFGYLGSVGVLLYKNFGQSELSWLEFFELFSYVTSIGCTAAFLYSMFYFARHPLTQRASGG